jgi:RNA polymerase sigma-70 factor (ECF subfamily)
MNGQIEAIEPLVAGAVGSSPEALDALLRATRPVVYRWALVRTGDEDDAEDVTQRVLVRVAANLHAFEGRARFTTWLYRVTMNAAAELSRQRGFLKRLRERWQNQLMAQQAVLPDPLATVQGERLRKAIEALLHRLPVTQRIAFDLIDLQGYSPSDAAQMLDIRDGTLRVNLLRARRTMRRLMLQTVKEETHET